MSEELILEQIKIFEREAAAGNAGCVEPLREYKEELYKLEAKKSKKKLMTGTNYESI